MWFMALLLVALAAGCGGGGSGGRDPILGGATGVLAPTVTDVAPLANAVGVPVNTKIITAAFSKAMDPSTLTTASFTLACGAAGTAGIVGTPKTPVTGGGAVTYPTAGSMATLPLPAATNLPANADCTATVTAVAKDITGIPLAANFTWNFTTGLTPDTTAPLLITTGAFDGETGLPINRNDTATFSEPMNPLTLASPATSYTVRETLTGTPVAGVVTYIGNTATFNPNSNLKPLTQYTSTITTGAKDLAGNALISGSRPNPWSWTTGAAADTIAPTVTLTSPANGATLVPANKKISATFSEDMKPATMITANFTVRETVLGTVVNGLVTYDVLTRIATFSPLADLKLDTDYTVTVTNGAQDMASNALVVPAVGGLPKPNPWTFRTAAAPIVLPVVNLGAADSFAIAATAGITNTPTAPITTINGDVVLDPNTTCNAVAIDAAGGFGLCGGSPPTINGKVASPLYPDAGATSGAVKLALQAAFLSITPLAGPPAAGALGGATAIPAGTTLGAPTGNALVQGDNLFVPGVYQSITSILITGDLTLDAQGDPNASFIFQSSSTIGTADGAASPAAHPRILLINGAKASNVFWQAGTSATLGTFTEWQGNILASADITMKTGAKSCGRLFAGAFTSGAFVFDSNVVSVPGNGC